MIMIQKMLEGENDIINVTTLANTFDEETNSIQLNGKNFMPYLEVNVQDYNMKLSELDIYSDYENGIFNMSKILNYADFVIHMYVRERDKELNLYRPLKLCSVSDFEKRNYNELNEETVKNLFCPDIDDAAMG